MLDIVDLIVAGSLLAPAVRPYSHKTAFLRAMCRPHGSRIVIALSWAFMGSNSEIAPAMPPAHCTSASAGRRSSLGMGLIERIRPPAGRPAEGGGRGLG